MISRWAAVALALVPYSADAHARLLQTVPAAGSELAEAPPEVRLVFDEPVTAALSGIAISGAGGELSVTGTDVPGDPTQVVVPLAEPLPAGAYRVHWHAVSADMHKVEGDFAFTVAP
jgi:copper resistance protein C